MGFEYDKFKVQVKLAISRIVSLQQKHQNSLCGRRKDIADLLKAGQEERARLQVKYLIRDDYQSEVYDLLQMLLDDLNRSALLISQEKRCDDLLAPTVKSIIYAAGRVEVPELLRIKDQLLSKYGKDWEGLAQAGADQRLVVKMGIRNPDGVLINRYLTAIAESYGIPWAPVPEEDLLHLDMESPIQPAQHNNVGGQSAAPPVYSQPPPPYSPATGVRNDGPVYTSAPPTPSPPPPAQDGVTDFDELARRFEALKGKK